MIIKRGTPFYSIKYEQKDWDNGLAVRMNEVLRSLPAKQRFFAAADREWRFLFKHLATIRSAKIKYEDELEFNTKPENNELDPEFEDDFKDIF